MTGTVDRRGFLVGGAAGAAALTVIGPGSAVAATYEEGVSFPSADPGRVREIVGASHGRIERVRELLAEEPDLAKAAWDWGFGDWETALGAASHVGNREIAMLLIEHGARPDLFTFAMLGRTDAVRAILEASPGLAGLGGPHGISLLSHARAGGDAAAGTLAYLEDRGDADPASTDVKLGDAGRDRVLGVYESPDYRVGVEVRRNGLMATVNDGPPRGLIALGGGAFRPAGSAAARFVFSAEGDRAERVRVSSGPVAFEASRVS